MLNMCGLVIALTIGAGFQAAAPAELKAFEFLIGEWSGQGGGQPGSGGGTAVFTRAVQGRVMLRTSYAEYPPFEGKPASRHDDLMVIYAGAGAGLRADYYDSEGHVIRYAVRSPASGEAVFVSEPAAGEPRYRLTYRLGADGVLKGEFAIASPDHPEMFKPYLTWESRKTK